jgi:hypothetical protein
MKILSSCNDAVWGGLLQLLLQLDKTMVKRLGPWTYNAED